MTAITIIKTYDIKSDKLKRSITVSVNADYLKSTYEQKLQEVLSGIKLPGFRQGKVPKDLVKQRYGPQIVRESAEAAVEKSFNEILEKENLRAAEQPKMDLKKVEIGSDLEYSADFESMPTIDPIDYEKISIDKPVIEVSDKDAEAVAMDMIKASPRWDAKKGAIKDGDKVKVDFEGKVDGKVFEGGMGKDIELVIGDGKFLKDFESGLHGAKSGETRKIDVVFPKEYHQAKLAGKDATFDVTINAVESATFHKLDAEWFKLRGSSAKTKKAYLEEIRPLEQKRADKIAGKIVRDRLSDALTASVNFEVPKSILDGELKNEGVDLDQLDAKAKKAKIDQVTKHLRYLLLVQHLVQELKIEASPAELELYLESVMPPGVDMNFFKSWYVQDQSRVDKIRIAVLEEKMLDRVKDMCKLKDVKMTLSVAKKLLNKEK